MAACRAANRNLSGFAIRPEPRMRVPRDTLPVAPHGISMRLL
jgi:hypothetical protein